MPSADTWNPFACLDRGLLVRDRWMWRLIGKFNDSKFIKGQGILINWESREFAIARKLLKLFDKFSNVLHNKSHLHDHFFTWNIVKLYITQTTFCLIFLCYRYRHGVIILLLKNIYKNILWKISRQKFRCI